MRGLKNMRTFSRVTNGITTRHHWSKNRFISTLNQPYSRYMKSNNIVKAASAIILPRKQHFCQNATATATATEIDNTSKKSEEKAESKYQITYLKDYKPPPYLVNSIDLDFDLYDGYTIVTNKMIIRHNELYNSKYNNNTNPTSIELDGDLSVELEKLSINGNSDNLNYTISPITGSLTINIDNNNNNRFYNENNEIEIEIVTRIKPEINKSFMGLYRSKSLYCTQCEAQGFRKITYFFDRPDVTTKYITTIRGNKDKFPILLSNGNPINSGNLDNNRHFVTWQDPFAKPSYLFALVAGDLQYIEKNIITKTNKKNVNLRIYTEKHNIDKCEWAMKSLVQSFLWDEYRFGLEYDLERFNIVAVDDFNMGAMENKSLNIFNSKYILANNDIATDTDYHNIQRVVGHEYFHNYTGNRVTLRDWFQLSLKEGLTVFRDQEFSSDLNIRGVERIDQVKMLQATQFKEDNGPMSHPVRPDSYMEINNFYTVTVYEKGAEVVRMIETIIGKELFTKGLKYYLETFDGQACTIENFIDSMEYVSNGKFDLSQMYTWYQQSGTPEVKINTEYDKKNGIYKLHLTQNFNDTPNQPSKNKKPFLIPLKTSLLKNNEKNQNNLNYAMSYPLKLNDKSKDGPFETTLLLDEKEKTFTFYGIDDGEPLLSINRNFSAPVYVQHGVTSEDLSLLAVHDTDSFNRWNAINKLYSISIIENYMNNNNSNNKNSEYVLNHHLRQCVNKLLRQFIPPSVKNEYKSEQASLKRKDILRNQRQKAKEQSKLQQFILDDMNPSDSLANFENLQKDFESEQLIDDLIGDAPLPRDMYSQKQRTSNASSIDPLLTSRLLQLPSFDYLFPLIADSSNNNINQQGGNPQLLVETIENLRSELGYKLYPQFLNCYTWCRDQLSKLSLHPQYANNNYQGWLQARCYRSLLNICLRYMNIEHSNKTEKQNTQSKQILFEQYQLARNMTEMMGALEAIVNVTNKDLQTARDDMLSHFYRHFEQEPLVIQKWLRLQSTAVHNNAIEHVYKLLKHESYDQNNPNCVYALIGGFAFSNPLNFHDVNGKGYKLLSEQIKILDETNESVAARLCKAYENVAQLDKNRQNLIAIELDSILSKNNVSKGTFEVSKKILDGINNVVKK